MESNFHVNLNLTINRVTRAYSVIIFFISVPVRLSVSHLISDYVLALKNEVSICQGPSTPFKENQIILTSSFAVTTLFLLTSII